MIYDIFSYNGEEDILKLRLELLYPHVDRFIICEAKTTFSGNPKPLYFSSKEKLFQEWWSKIDYYIIDEAFTAEERALAESSPNTRGAKHWKREFLQKENIKKAFINLKDDDICYIGDVDEIWDPLYSPKLPLEKLKLRVYAYYLNNRSNEEFWGTVVGKWGDIKPHCLNHLRSDITLRGAEYGGWHFTSMGGVKEVRRKLNDSYTAESYNTTDVQKLLQQRVTQGVDYLGRPFEFNLDNVDWPPYMFMHRKKFQNLCKRVP